MGGSWGTVKLEEILACEDSLAIPFPASPFHRNLMNGGNRQECFRMILNKLDVPIDCCDTTQ